MAKAKQIKTRYPGIYRVGKRYEWATWRGGPRGMADSIEDARAAKAKAEATRGAHATTTDAARATFGAYALDWIVSYQGRTSRGLDEGTRADYRRDLERYAIPYFDHIRRRKLGEIQPRDVRAFIQWLGTQCTPPTKRHPRGRKLTQATITNRVAPLKALLACALEDGDLLSNPAAGVRVLAAERIDIDYQDGAERRRALTRLELGRFLRALPDDDWRLAFELLAQTGVRWGEFCELRGKDLDREGRRPVLRVRRSYSVKATRDPHTGERVTTGRVKVPKSRHSRRDIPLSPTMARRLWRLQRDPEQLLFTTPTGERLRRENTYRRILAPAAQAAGVEWMAFHSLRHTCASLLFEDGRNIKQIQHWLGHHSAAYTLSTYVHLMDNGAGDADFLDAVIADALTRAARESSGGDEGEIEPRNQPEIPSAPKAANPA